MKKGRSSRIIQFATLVAGLTGKDALAPIVKRYLNEDFCFSSGKSLQVSVQH